MVLFAHQCKDKNWHYISKGRYNGWSKKRKTFSPYLNLACSLLTVQYRQYQIKKQLQKSLVAVILEEVGRCCFKDQAKV